MNFRICREEVMPLVASSAAMGPGRWMQRPVSWLRRRCYHLPVAAGQGEFTVPTPADEARLWALVEAAWAPLGPEVRQARQELVTRYPGSRADISIVEGALPAFLGILAGCSREQPALELTRLDRVVERKLIKKRTQRAMICRYSPTTAVGVPREQEVIV
jgi:hypothetical protein